MNKTRGSKQSIRIGLVKTTVTIWLRSVFSSSIGATMLSSPVSFRNRWARCLRMMGPYVSGKKRIIGDDAPAMMAPIQNAQLHDTVEMKPETRGPRTGPNIVAAYACQKHWSGLGHDAHLP